MNSQNIHNIMQGENKYKEKNCSLKEIKKMHDCLDGSDSRIIGHPQGIIGHPQGPI